MLEICALLYVPALLLFCVCNGGGGVIYSSLFLYACVVRVQVIRQNLRELKQRAQQQQQQQQQANASSKAAAAVAAARAIGAINANGKAVEFGNGPCKRRSNTDINLSINKLIGPLLV